LNSLEPRRPRDLTARLLASLLMAAPLACSAPAVLRQGGADFREVKQEPPAAALESLFGVCWPQEALAAEQVWLTWMGDDVIFEARGGASNSTARCLRELATTAPPTPRPAGPLQLSPPSQPLDGWAVLAWVKLLAPSRFGPERGLTDPAGLVRACLDHGGLRPSAAFTVRHVPGPEVRVLPSALSEAERCVEAVLGSTAWPSPRALFFTLRPSAASPAAAGEVGFYFSPPGATGVALDPQVVRETVRLAQPKVAACWEAALLRRTSIGGSRTLRFRVDERGAVTRAWVAAGLGEGAVAADYLLDRCLVSALSSARFPPAAGDGFYSWVFASR
jgi:hypothetical protein